MAVSEAQRHVASILAHRNREQCTRCRNLDKDQKYIYDAGSRIYIREADMTPYFLILDIDKIPTSTINR